MEQCSKTLLLILGPTGVGKTELSLRVAEHYGCPILNCDSRQVFKGIPIGTAAPTAEEQARVKHYFVATRELEEDYNAGQYERDALELIEQLFEQHDVLVMTGGSMLYADAVCNGLDDLPSVPAQIRQQVSYPRTLPDGKEESREEWLKWLQSEVQRLDPAYWTKVDQQNPARLAHCVELCMTTGKPYSSLLTKPSAISRQLSARPFRIIKIALERPRAELYARIDARAKQMMNDGLLDEAKAVYPKRQLNSLQTVGYKELFAYMDGEYDLSRAIELIQQNTRHYAKRQLTWFRRDKEIHWLNANDDYEKNISLIDNYLRADGVQEE
jgi:tRNA dimethylallyltransferase